VDAFEAGLAADPKAAAGASPPSCAHAGEPERDRGAAFGRRRRPGIARELRARLSMIDGRAAFKLYDTYGFPIEITTEMARKRA
jgi:hypothetical protein